MQGFTSSGLCPPKDIYSTIKSALDEWKAARGLLATTIQSYRAACATLRTISALHVHQPPEHRLVEKLFLTVNSELDSLAAEEDTLYIARMSLAAMRNESSTLVRANALPLEILTGIFALSKSYCVHDDKRCFQNFAGVCTYWRRIAMHTTDLWAHIDVGPSTSVNLTKLLLERTKNTPIHLHLFEPEPERASEHEALKYITVLKPHIHHVRSLEMESHWSFGSSMGALLNLWLTSGSHNLARSLLVLRPYAKTLLSYGGSSEGAKIINRSENAKEMLRALSKLHLQNTRFDWDSGLYRGLVELRLNSSCTKISISVSQLADILAANPALHALELSSLRVTRQENWSYPSPIVLGCLRSLILLSLDQESLQLMLPLIGLPTPAAELNIAFVSPSHMDRVLENFLAHSDVTRLYWCNSIPSRLPNWMPVLKPPPRLRDLILEGFWTGGILPEGKIIPRPPFLDCPPTVTLLCCAVTLDGLKGLIVNYGIQDLRLERCAPQNGSEDLETIKSSLLGAYSGLKCIISDTASASQWVYRSLHN